MLDPPFCYTPPQSPFIPYTELFCTDPQSLVVAKYEAVMAPGDTHTPRLPMEPDSEDAVIDVDALSQVGVTPSAKGKAVAVAKREPPSAKGKAVAKRVPVDEIIDVDNPHKLTGSAAAASVPTSVVGLSAGGPSQLPQMKFDGALGVTLYEQKLDVMAQDAEAASEPLGASKKPPASDGARTAGAMPSAHHEYTRTLGEAVAKAREEILADRVDKLNMPWPPIVAGMTAPPDAPSPPAESSPDAESSALEGVASASSKSPASCSSGTGGATQQGGASHSSGTGGGPRGHSCDATHSLKVEVGPPRARYPAQGGRNDGGAIRAPNYCVSDDAASVGRPVTRQAGLGRRRWR